MEKYTREKLALMFDMNKITVYKRFASPYAKERWGVVTRKRADGSITKYVPEDKLDLWKSGVRYVGRPVFEK